MSLQVYQTFIFFRSFAVTKREAICEITDLLQTCTIYLVYTHTLLSHFSYTYNRTDQLKTKKIITMAVKGCKLTALSLRNLIFTRPFRRIKKGKKKTTDHKVWGQSDTLTFYQDFPQKSASSQIFSLSKLPDNFPALLLLPLMSCSDSVPCSVSLWML